MKSKSSTPHLLRSLVIGALFMGLPFALRAEIQTFSLAAQWNLITFQVTPNNPNPEALFSTLPGFQSAWTYEAASGLWLRYVKPTGGATQQTNDAIANQLLA